MPRCSSSIPPSSSRNTTAGDRWILHSSCAAAATGAPRRKCSRVSAIAHSSRYGTPKFFTTIASTACYQPEPSSNWLARRWWKRASIRCRRRRNRIYTARWNAVRSRWWWCGRAFRGRGRRSTSTLRPLIRIWLRASPRAATCYSRGARTLSRWSRRNGWRKKSSGWPLLLVEQIRPMQPLALEHDLGDTLRRRDVDEGIAIHQ